jgi:hypothetical protein
VLSGGAVPLRVYGANVESAIFVQHRTGRSAVIESFTRGALNVGKKVIGHFAERVHARNITEQFADGGLTMTGFEGVKRLRSGFA